MTFALWFWGGMLALHLVYAVFVVRELRRSIPGWQLRSFDGGARRVVRGRLMEGASAATLAPLSEQPCLAWAVRMVGRQGLSLVELVVVHSAAVLGLETDSRIVVLNLRPWTESSHAMRFIESRDWELTPRDFATSTTLRVGGGELLEPSSMEVGRKGHAVMTPRVLDWISERSCVAPHLVDQTTPIAYHITEYRLLAGQEYLCEAPVAGGTGEQIGLADPRTDPMKLAPAHRLRFAVLRQIARSFAVFLIVDAVFALVFVFAWLSTFD